MPDLSILDIEYPLSPEQKDFYREHAFIKLKEVLPAGVIEYFDEVITASVFELNTMHLPISKRDTLNKAFLQVQNIWEKNELVKAIVFSRRLAKIANDLMGTRGVRLYHDQALYKEPGGGVTPWHADQFYWPVSNDNTITAWIPLQATPVEMGPLEFSAKSHTVVGGRDMRLKTPVNSNQQIDWDTWCPGAIIGEQIDTPLNPILYSY